jgi:hypothetical protein
MPAIDPARLQRHEALATLLEGTDDTVLAEWLAQAPGRSSSFGGHTASLSFDAGQVFCKLVPLTARELEPGRWQSTANHFGLPTYYQYGIGSVGFGAWRELAAHQLASGWVLQGLHDQFPLLHHWRVLKNTAAADANDGAEAEAYLHHAAGEEQDESAIRDRLAALRAAPAHIAVFTEHLPWTLQDWLRQQLQTGGSQADAAVPAAEAWAARALAFLQTQGCVHFDAHCNNILTDGTRLYMADFGLAVHPSFALDSTERQFLQQHAGYDAARLASSLVHAVLGAVPGEEPWRDRLQAHAVLAAALPPTALAALQRHGPTALAMSDFFHRLTSSSRHTPFPLPFAAPATAHLAAATAAAAAPETSP